MRKITAFLMAILVTIGSLGFTGSAFMEGGLTEEYEDITSYFSIHEPKIYKNNDSYAGNILLQNGVLHSGISLRDGDDLRIEYNWEIGSEDDNLSDLKAGTGICIRLPVMFNDEAFPSLMEAGKLKRIPILTPEGTDIGYFIVSSGEIIAIFSQEAEKAAQNAIEATLPQDKVISGKFTVTASVKKGDIVGIEHNGEVDTLTVKPFYGGGGSTVDPSGLKYPGNTKDEASYSTLHKRGKSASSGIEWTIDVNKDQARNLLSNSDEYRHLSDAVLIDPLEKGLNISGTVLLSTRIDIPMNSHYQDSGSFHPNKQETFSPSSTNAYHFHIETDPFRNESDRTLEEFKHSLAEKKKSSPLPVVGIYTDPRGKQVLLVYFGDIGNPEDVQSLTYDRLVSEYKNFEFEDITNFANAKAEVSEGKAEISPNQAGQIEYVYTEGKSKGRVAYWTVQFETDISGIASTYPSLNNTATLYTSNLGADLSENISVRINAASGSATVPPGQKRIIILSETIGKPRDSFRVELTNESNPITVNKGYAALTRPIMDSQGRKINYELKVIRDTPVDYLSEIRKTESGDTVTFNIVNTELTEMTIDKKWNNGGSGAPEGVGEIQFGLYGDGKFIQDITLKKNTYWGTIAHLPKYDKDSGSLIRYVLKEKTVVPSYIAEDSYYKPGPADAVGQGSLQITNTELMNIVLEQQWWKDGQQVQNPGVDSSTLVLSGRDGAGNSSTQEYTLTQNSDAGKNWKEVLSLRKYDKTSFNPYRYTIKQKETVPGWTTEYISNRDADGSLRLIAINRKNSVPAKTKIHFNITWSDGGQNTPPPVDSIQVVLLRKKGSENTRIGEYTVKKDERWRKTIEVNAESDVSYNIAVPAQISDSTGTWNSISPGFTKPENGELTLPVLFESTKSPTEPAHPTQVVSSTTTQKASSEESEQDTEERTDASTETTTEKTTETTTADSAALTDTTRDANISASSAESTAEFGAEHTSGSSSDTKEGETDTGAPTAPIETPEIVSTAAISETEEVTAATTAATTRRTMEFIEIAEDIPLGVKIEYPLDLEEIIIEESVPLGFAVGTDFAGNHGGDPALNGGRLPYTGSGAPYLFIGFGLLVTTIGMTIGRRM